MPGQLSPGRGEQAVPLVDHVRPELLEQHAPLQLEIQRVQQITEIFRQPRAPAELLLLQGVVQLGQRAAKRHLLQRKELARLVADVRGEHHHFVPFGLQRLDELPDVGRGALGAQDGNPEVGGQIRDSH
jgi:hypothetical protein